jgi:RNA polymerase sigma-70 factor (ECF subfamily)
LLVAARRDPSSFAAFYRDQHADLFRFLYRQVLCPEIAADLTAETFAIALAHIGRFDPARGDAPQWLRGIARNRVRAWARSGAVAAKARQRLGMTTPLFTEVDTAMIDERHDAGPLLAAVRAALESMKPVDREVIQLRVVDGLGYEMIAARLGCSPGAARVRCSRALARLRADLDVRVPDLEDRLL